ncbi:OmpH family outer membrane protein [Kangiella koreensis]|uniref:Outer membrane chaperone Skp (OmpH) n=1 Tax=Kangiella koreensis (strain DSM 16069 / JCM 12317 / KCTC 12182 / SW-125) TaxID=523791 RepID=C7R5Y9_KANKD|nr:OmpH family outer membrane protein [Kangiella koreensis]ACV27313.1 outer membrane chaperone Skp (OmpH) [Kangiella koreensis DSM 16069]
MKKLLALFLFILVSTPSMASAELKVGIINFGEVMAKVPQKDAINQTLQKEFSGREDELKRLGEEIEAARTDYVNNVATMSESQATEKKRSIQQKMSDYKLKEAAFKEDLEKRSREEQSKLGGQIRDAVEVVAKKGGYNILLDRQSAPYIDASVPDVTAQVLSELSK